MGTGVYRDINGKREEISEAELAEMRALAADLLPANPPAFVYKLDLFERATEAEAGAIRTAMSEQPYRTQMIFEAAQSFREDHELWPLLTTAATGLFGPERASELLAPSV